MLSGTDCLPNALQRRLCSLIRRSNSSNFDSMMSMSPKLKFITLIKSVVSACKSLLPEHGTSARFLPVFVWYFSYHFSYFVVSSAKMLWSVRALFFLASSVGFAAPLAGCHCLHLHQQCPVWTVSASPVTSWRLPTSVLASSSLWPPTRIQSTWSHTSFQLAVATRKRSFQLRSATMQGKTSVTRVAHVAKFLRLV